MAILMSMLTRVAQILKDSSRCAVLTGAGISAESGVPTFRGEEGLWGKFRAEELATMDAFLANSKIVWEWYNWRRELMGGVKPNPGHFALCELAAFFEQFTLITQNVDNLHRMAGSEDVLELHGNIHRNKCADCNRPVDISHEVDPDDIPTCSHCNGRIRPDVVWFGEMLPESTIERAFAETRKAEIFLSVGTSALVHPAASLPVMAKQQGATLVEINPNETPLTPMADFYFSAKAGELLPQLVSHLKDTTLSG